MTKGRTHFFKLKETPTGSLSHITQHMKAGLVSGKYSIDPHLYFYIYQLQFITSNINSVLPNKFDAAKILFIQIQPITKEKKFLTKSRFLIFQLFYQK
jgi:hypothetical protein